MCAGKRRIGYLCRQRVQCGSKGGTFNAADNGNGSVLGYGGGSKAGMGYLYVQGGNFNGTIYTGLPYEVRLMAGVYSAEPPAEYVHKVQLR